MALRALRSGIMSVMGIGKHPSSFAGAAGYIMDDDHWHLTGYTNGAWSTSFSIALGSGVPARLCLPTERRITPASCLRHLALAKVRDKFAQSVSLPYFHGYVSPHLFLIKIGTVWSIIFRCVPISFPKSLFFTIMPCRKKTTIVQSSGCVAYS